jgi:hypothetical protein
MLLEMLSKRLIMRDFSCEKWRIVTEKEKFNSFVEPPKKNFLRSTYTSVSVLTLSKKNWASQVEGDCCRFLKFSN